MFDGFRLGMIARDGGGVADRTFCLSHLEGVMLPAGKLDNELEVVFSALPAGTIAM